MNDNGTDMIYFPVGFLAHETPELETGFSIERWLTPDEVKYLRSLTTRKYPYRK
jgi:hypothetical protein